MSAPPLRSRPNSDRHARRLEPVLGERALELLDHRPFDADVGVALVPGLLSVPAPFPADPGASGHAHHAVDDENPAMVSVVNPVRSSDGMASAPTASRSTLTRTPA